MNMDTEETKYAHQVSVKLEPETLNGTEEPYIKQENDLEFFTTEENGLFQNDIDVHNLDIKLEDSELHTDTNSKDSSEATTSNTTKSTSNAVIEIRPSIIHEKGTFATRQIPVGMQFGPYKVVVCLTESSVPYLCNLEVEQVGKDSTSTSNWLQHINCVEDSSQQNLALYQYHGNVVYRTVKPIEKDEELLVYYDESFAEMFGTDETQLCNSEDEKKDFQLKESKECKYCQRRFHYIGNKNRHEIQCAKDQEKIKVVKNRKVFSCSQCNFTTDYAGGLNRHYVMHNRNKANEFEKLFSCSICNFKSIYLNSLKTHYLTHVERKVNTVKKLFTCSICNFKTYYRDGFRSHYVEHETENVEAKVNEIKKMLPCCKCNFKTYYTHSLRRHVYLAHNETEWVYELL